MALGGPAWHCPWFTPQLIMGMPTILPTSTTLNMNPSSAKHHPSLQYFPVTTQGKNLSATCDSSFSVILHM